MMQFFFVLLVIVSAQARLPSTSIQKVNHFEAIPTIVSPGGPQCHWDDEPPMWIWGFPVGPIIYSYESVCPTVPTVVNEVFSTANDNAGLIIVIMMMMSMVMFGTLCCVILYVMFTPVDHELEPVLLLSSRRVSNFHRRVGIRKHRNV